MTVDSQKTLDPNVLALLDGELTEALIALADKYSTAAQNILSVFEKSTLIREQYNELFATKKLLGFDTHLDDGTGAVFDGSRPSVVFNILADGSLKTGGQDHLALILAHEGQHAENHDRLMPVVNKNAEDFSNAINTALAVKLTESGRVDITDILLAHQQGSLVNEAMAELQGWNGYVDYMKTAKPEIFADIDKLKRVFGHPHGYGSSTIFTLYGAKCQILRPCWGHVFP